ncbi:MAG: sodium:calcium antiporter [Planctomycetota bacterium]
MNTALSVVLFVIGLALVLYFAEKLVEGVVGTSVGFGVSAFVLSVVFIGFDPENLGVGAVGSFEGSHGIALGAIVGAAMVAIALAFGLTAIFAPMEFGKAPRSVLVIPVAAGALLAVLARDGLLSRLDGIFLLLGFAVAVLFVVFLSRRGMDIEPGGEVEEVLEEEDAPGRWKSLGLFVVALAAIIAGSELLVHSAQHLIEAIGISDTLFGMTILAFLVSIEELARELPAAMKGRADITFGNVVGSVLAFFLFNAGIIALVRPVQVGTPVLHFYLPVALATIVFISLLMFSRRMPRWAGVVLLAAYVAFVAGGFTGWA